MKRFQLTTACLACLWALPSNGLHQSLDDIDSSLAVLRAMGWEYEYAFTGITDLTEFQEPIDFGMGQEIARRCEVNPATGVCEELDPIELKRLEAEGKSGKDRADLAEMLTAAADGAIFAGVLLEFGIGREAGIGPTGIGAETAGAVLNNPLVDDPRAARCGAAQASNDARTQRAVVSGDSPDTTEDLQRRKAEAFFSPIALMTEASCMLLVASETLTSAQGQAPIEAASAASMLAALDQIVYHGAEEVGNSSAHRLSIDNPGLTETMDGGQQFVVDRIERWIHIDYLAEIKTRVSGTLTHRGETRALFIEKEFGDFRWVPGTQLHHPYRNTSRVGGIFTDEELEEMGEAAESLDEIEQQMAAMSPRERQQMQQMLGPRINQLRTMVDSGVFEFTLITKRVLVNTDAREALSGNVSYEPKLLTQEIQSNLKVLGYDPGDIDGELSRATVVAIVRFERDYQLEPTGRPSPELARIMSATLSAIR